MIFFKYILFAIFQLFFLSNLAHAELSCIGNTYEPKYTSISNFPSVKILTDSESIVAGDTIDIDAEITMDQYAIPYYRWCTNVGSLERSLNSFKSIKWILPSTLSETDEAVIYVTAGDSLGHHAYDRKSFSTGSVVTDKFIVDAPLLFTLGNETSKNSIKLQWLARNTVALSNVEGYEIDYADNGFFTNATSVKVQGKTEATISNLEDNKRYYFKVRGYNSVSNNAQWSNSENITVKLEDTPYFDEFNRQPANAATHVDKLPRLIWYAYDKDGDDLDYRVLIGESPDSLRSVRSFKQDEYDKHYFDFKEQGERALKPNTKYYWKVQLREQGRSRDYYGGEYIANGLRTFTTITDGSDLSIEAINLQGEVKPDSEVSFEITVKNKGTEIAKAVCFDADYIKQSASFPFRRASGCMSQNLAPNATEKVLVTVGFQDSDETYNGVHYDNVLVSGSSEIEFYFDRQDVQDTVKSNNKKRISIQYENAGAPDITHFDVQEYGRQSDGNTMWARAGKDVKILVQARDDVQIVNALVQYKYADGDWITIESFDNHNDGLTKGSFFWHLDAASSTRDAVRIRVVVTDDAGASTERVSLPFSIYSNQGQVSSVAENTSYKLGGAIGIIPDYQGEHDLRYVKFYLACGAYQEKIFEHIDNTGFRFESRYEATIPNDDKFVSQQCKIKTIISDVRHNLLEHFSEAFVVNPQTELPEPFTESKLIFDIEANFPSDAESKNESVKTKFVELDDNNIAHVVLEHRYTYMRDTASGNGEDEQVNVSNLYYVTYNKTNGNVSQPILITDYHYRAVDLTVLNGNPQVLLENTSGNRQLAISSKVGNGFSQPAVILNQNVPAILDTYKLSSHPNRLLANSTDSVYANGYLWQIDTKYQEEILRYSFSNGRIGNEERVRVTTSSNVDVFNDIEPSSWTQPVVDGNYIYYIVRREDVSRKPMMVRFRLH